MNAPIEMWIAKQLGASPHDATRYVRQVSVGIGFAVAAVIFGELKVAFLLSILVLATAHFTLWLATRRELDKRLVARLEYSKMDVKAVAAPFEALLNQHNGTVVTAHTYGSTGPIVVFKAPLLIAQWLNQIVSSTGFGRTDITYIWGLNASRRQKLRIVKGLVLQRRVERF